MGVPALFRWLSQKYPKITTPVIEELPDEDADGTEIPVDWTLPNPNKWELDNLYLDMNGIIHPCCHPEDKPAPDTEDAMFVEIFAYIDRIMAMTRPRKVVYMAIDGVAPRAKMNQQRSRRFRAAQEAYDKAEDEKRLKDEWEADHDPLPEKIDGSGSHTFDSNCITPGTPFMANLAVCLRYYITDRMGSHPAWKGLKIILSDASAPGEGEHKIMDYIRRQRCQPTYDPNTTHCLYGLDADLIMLALATHEPHFRILREDVFAKETEGRGKCFICGQGGHQAAQCTGKKKEKEEVGVNSAARKPFIFLHVPVLREYLDAELKLGDNSGIKWSLERAIDDWVFLVFFVGNDFLPHLPSLEIREGAIDTLINLWKRIVPEVGDYLTLNGEVNLDAVGRVLVELGKHEDGIFRERRRKEEQKKEAQIRREKEAEQRRNGGRPEESSHFRFNGAGVPEVVSAGGLLAEVGKATKPSQQEPKKLTAAQKIAERIQGEQEAAVLAMAVPRRDPRALGLPNSPDPARTKANMAAAASLREKLLKKKPGGSDAGSSRGTPAPEEKEEKEDVKMENEDEEVKEEVVKEEDTEMTTDATAEELEDARGIKRKADDIEEIPVPAEVTIPDAVPAVTLTEIAEPEDVKAVLSEEEEEIERELAEDEAEEELEVEDTLTVADVPIPHKPLRRESIKNAGEGDEEPYDDVRLWEDGWKERYYRNKFGVAETDAAFKAELVKAYVEGFSWVLKYYYQGVQSWKWFYPYHYSPFASDFIHLEDLSINFEIGTPFKPIEQLMGVLPAGSKAHIPPTFHPLMEHEDSEIIDFYPEKFQIDLNGKKYAWQGVALLPFIDEARLLAAIEPRYKLITDEERERNERGPELIFIGPENPIYDAMCSVYGDGAEPAVVGSHGDTFGTLKPDPNVCKPGSTFVSPLKTQDLPDLEKTEALSAEFQHPQVGPDYIYKAELLPTVKMPDRILSADDIHWIRMGRPGRQDRGGRFGGAAARFANQGMDRGSPRNGGYDNNRSGSWGGDRDRGGDRDNRDRDGGGRGGYNRQWTNDNSRRDDYSEPRRSASFPDRGGAGGGGGGWRPSSSYSADSYRPQAQGSQQYGYGGGGNRGGGSVTSYGSGGGTITAYGGGQQAYGGQQYGAGLNPSAQAFVPGGYGGPSYGQQSYQQTATAGYQQQQYGQQAYGAQPTAYGSYPPVAPAGFPAPPPGMIPFAAQQAPYTGAAPPPPLQAPRPPNQNLAYSRNIASTSNSGGRGTYQGGGGYRPSR